MKSGMLSNADGVLENKRRRQKWKRLAGVLGCLVMIGTTYVLMRPAETLERELICGMEEHKHSVEQGCYRQVAAEAALPICGWEEGETGHVHSDECYSEESVLTCTEPESETHRHEDSCYTTEHIQTCGLMEMKNHMEQSRTQQEFVAYMNAYGYDVKWEPHQKHITYTTPENIRCRDSKLFDQTLKRENMELYFRLGGADYLQACREIAYDHREPTPTLEDAVCGMAGTVAAICALCEDEDSEVSDLARELYYSSLLLQELVEWYQSRRQEQENYEEEYEQYHGFDMTMM